MPTTRCKDCERDQETPTNRRRRCDDCAAIRRRRGMADRRAVEGSSSTSIPARLTISSGQRKAERQEWVQQALRLARKARVNEDEATVDYLVNLAERTAGGTVQVVGSHTLGEVLVDVELTDATGDPFSVPGQRGDEGYSMWKRGIVERNMQEGRQQR